MPDPDNADFAPSITSFLCTGEGRCEVDECAASIPGEKLPIEGSLTNQQCLDEARRFFTYADVEGFRGSPHRP